MAKLTKVLSSLGIGKHGKNADLMSQVAPRNPARKETKKHNEKIMLTIVVDKIWLSQCIETIPKCCSVVADSLKPHGL